MEFKHVNHFDIYDGRVRSLYLFNLPWVLQEPHKYIASNPPVILIILFHHTGRSLCTQN